MKSGNQFLMEKKSLNSLDQVYAFPVIICTTEKFSKSEKIGSCHKKKSTVPP